MQMRCRSGVPEGEEKEVSDQWSVAHGKSRGFDLFLSQTPHTDMLRHGKFIINIIRSPYYYHH